jgi:hypothetical protein
MATIPAKIAQSEMVLVEIGSHQVFAYFFSTSGEYLAHIGELYDIWTTIFPKRQGNFVYASKMRAFRAA